MRFGVHCSLKNGLSGALEEAKAKGCEAMQIFTRSPRMWRMTPPENEEIAKFLELKEAYGIHPVVVHAPYLPNLATSDKELYKKSLKLLTEDMVIANAIKAEYMVIHPGSYSEGSSLKTGIENISSAINKALSGAPGRTVILLENVAGGGRRIGSRFEELRDIISGIKSSKNIGVCLDTAHALGAGFEISSRKGVSAMAAEFDEKIGFKNLQILHLNDSKAELNSHRDRHQHIGKGYIGLEGFKSILKSFSFAQAGILETPKDSPSADTSNLKVLFRLRKTS